MSLPDQTPKLSKIPFLVGDAALLGVAWFIAEHSRSPLGANAIIGIVTCVALGALIAAIPFLSDYARKQDEALDERQRGLEALSRTVNTAAEQISIAANGLHEITEIAHKNLKQAELLPQKLQEKVAEFTARLDNAREDDREELEKELAELRAGENERLEAAADKVQKALAELTKLDAVAQKHLTARAELLQKTNDAITKSQADASAALNAATGALTRELLAAQTKALAEIDAKLAERTAAALAAIEAATAAARAAMVVPPPPAPAAEPPAATTPAAPPKHPRKSRREESPASAEAATLAEVPAPTAPEAAAPAVTEPVEPALVEPAPAVVAAPVEPPPEPAPIPAEMIPVIEPVAPPSSDPFPPPAAAAPEPPVAPATPPAEPPVALAPVPVPDEPPAPPPAEPTAALETPPAPAPLERPAKKRVRKPDLSNDLSLDLGGEGFGSPSSDESQVAPAEAGERVISSDGATRLIATAYIGIGNRLFIRGDGPGLSWEKGVPLQFVSIGKWRWETSDATAPIAFKLYKNDDIECAALGRQTLDPGHQQEVAAKF